MKQSEAKNITDEKFRHYFEANFENIFVYAFTIVKDQVEAKDIAQSAFIKLWEKRGEVAEERSVRAYLYTTAYHLALNAVRNKRIHGRHHEHLRTEESLHTVFTQEQKELKDNVWNAVNELPPRCREVFLKCKMEGKRYAEVANELDISEKTVEAQMLKAMRSLREKLRHIVRALIFFLFV